MSEKTFLSKKKFFNNSKSILDIIMFVVAGFSAWTIVSTWILGKAPFFVGNMSLTSALMAGIFVGVVSLMFAMNKYEEDIAGLALLFAIGVSLYTLGVIDNSTINNVKYSVQKAANSITLSNDGVSGNNYQQTPQNLPELVDEPVQNTKTNQLATIWNKIGVSQKLSRGQALNEAGLEWCKTADANKTNQGRLHCRSGFVWSKNGWSNRNDTRVGDGTYN